MSLRSAPRDTNSHRLSIDVPTLQRDELTPPQTGERRQQHKEPEPRGHQVGKPVDLIYRGMRPFGCPMLVSPLDAARIALDAADINCAERDRLRPGRLGVERALTLAGETLTRYGFEPSRETGTLVRLRNCPFHPMAAKAPELVCGINHAFLTGFLTGLQARTVHADLAPSSGECCVELRAEAPARG